VQRIKFEVGQFKKLRTLKLWRVKALVTLHFMKDGRMPATLTSVNIHGRVKDLDMAACRQLKPVVDLRLFPMPSMQNGAKDEDISPCNAPCYSIVIEKGCEQLTTFSTIGWWIYQGTDLCLPNLEHLISEPGRFSTQSLNQQTKLRTYTERCMMEVSMETQPDVLNWCNPDAVRSRNDLSSWPAFMMGHPSLETVTLHLSHSQYGTLLDQLLGMGVDRQVYVRVDHAVHVNVPLVDGQWEGEEPWHRGLALGKREVQIDAHHIRGLWAPLATTRVVRTRLLSLSQAKALPAIPPKVLSRPFHPEAGAARTFVVKRVLLGAAGSSSGAGGGASSSAPGEGL
jgi:hypothetical protein